VVEVVNLNNIWVTQTSYGRRLVLKASDKVFVLRQVTMERFDSHIAVEAWLISFVDGSRRPSAQAGHDAILVQGLANEATHKRSPTNGTVISTGCDYWVFKRTVFIDCADHYYFNISFLC
jgi:hypothetical protein